MNDVPGRVGGMEALLPIKPRGVPRVACAA